MEDFKPLVWISLMGLFIAFGAVCLLRFVFRKNPGLLKYKLRIGGIILTITGVMTLGGHGQVMCYEIYVADTGRVQELDSISYVNLTNTNRVRFHLSSYPLINKMSYKLEDDASNLIESKDIRALDRSFDNNEEEFHVFLPMLTNGNYRIQFYKTSRAKQSSTNKIATYSFRVSNF